MTPDQFQQLIQLISEPYASMIYVAVYTDLRASELVGLRWKNVHADSITIDERYSGGEWGPPKSDASNATIAVNQCVLERIHRLKTLTVDVRAGKGAVRHYRAVKSAGPEDLVFQLVSRSAPRCPNNVLFKRTVARYRLGQLASAPSFARNLAQAQMLHSRASTTLDIYQQFVPASQRQAVDRLTTLATNGLIN